MNPDETKLALWLDDELSGAELAEMEAWASERPEQLAAREELRAFRNMISENLPSSEEPPFPDFFNSRVIQGIRDEQSEEEANAPAPAVRSTRAFWRSWLVPMAACAGMAFAFVVGKQSTKTNQPLAVVPTLSPVVYTPEDGVDAQWFNSKDASATVILLSGVTDIPDAMDFSETVYIPIERDADRTATRGNLPSGAGAQ
ncbi:hypothetical protein [Luteolibacter sp. AS25]|uniref:hypothetical protein n=1 Tax=Luteolibacter sp. AS25 TaxID=3135776 RepID=UPI00398AEBC8